MDQSEARGSSESESRTLGSIETPIAIRRSLRSASRVSLVGRSVRILLAPEDGVGDVTVTVARVNPGKMNAHRHGPGGEAMYIPSGRGILWVEGIPLTLEAGQAAFAPEGILHNAENTGRSDLIVIGAFCPAAVPGSYAEVPPVFAPTGRLESVTDLSHRARSARRSRRGGLPAVEDLIDDPHLSPNIIMRKLTVQSESSVLRSPTLKTRAWVVIRGWGDVTLPLMAAGRLGRFDVLAGAPGVALAVTAGPDPLTLIEFEASPTSEGNPS